jgi:hypothetical protein
VSAVSRDLKSAIMPKFDRKFACCGLAAALLSRPSLHCNTCIDTVDTHEPTSFGPHNMALKTSPFTESRHCKRCFSSTNTCVPGFAFRVQKNTEVAAPCLHLLAKRSAIQTQPIAEHRPLVSGRYALNEVVNARRSAPPHASPDPHPEPDPDPPFLPSRRRIRVACRPCICTP